MQYVKIIRFVQNYLNHREHRYTRCRTNPPQSPFTKGGFKGDYKIMNHVSCIIYSVNPVVRMRRLDGKGTGKH